MQRKAYGKEVQPEFCFYKKAGFASTRDKDFLVCLQPVTTIK